MIKKKKHNNNNDIPQSQIHISKGRKHQKKISIYIKDLKGATKKTQISGSKRQQQSHL